MIMLTRVSISTMLAFQLLIALGALGAQTASAGGPGATPRAWSEGGTLDEREELVLPLTTGEMPKSANEEDPCHNKNKGPSNWLLLGVGVGMAPVAYELGVMWHEGSHAAWASGFGARVTGWYPYPKEIPGNGFVFGYTTWTGQMTDAQTALTYVAPKLTDLTLLAAYTITNETGNLPKNKWAQLAIDALAVAAVVDLGHDVFATNPYSDIPEFYKNAHITSSSGQTGMRLLQGGLTLAGAAEVGHGLFKLFSVSAPEPQKPEAPKKVTAFSDFKVSPYVGSETLGVTGQF